MKPPYISARRPARPPPRPPAPLQNLIWAPAAGLTGRGVGRTPRPPTAASPDPFRTADILSVFHTSLHPQKPSLRERRGAGPGPELKMLGSRMKVGNRRCRMPLPNLRACAGGVYPCTSPCCLFLKWLGFVAHPPTEEYDGGRLTSSVDLF